MGSKPGRISPKGISAIKRSSRGNKWGRLKCKPKEVIMGTSQGAGIVTVYDRFGQIKGTIDPWTREFKK